MCLVIWPERDFWVWEAGRVKQPLWGLQQLSAEIPGPKLNRQGFLKGQGRGERGGEPTDLGLGS